MLEILLAFAAGLLIGSFLNVCIFRLPRDLSVRKPARSFCPGCERTIAWYDNIPLVSFALLGGRCRHCRERIPWRYPIVELATGAAFALSAATFGVTWEGVKYALFCAILIDLIATDLEERILPDEFTLGGTLLGLVLAYFIPLPPEIANLLWPALIDTPWLSVAESAIGACAVSLPLWALGVAYGRLRGRDVLGLGDVKMMMMAGAFLGLKLVLLTFLLGALLGSVLGLAFILVARKKASEYELPFGMFLGIAGLVVVFWGPAIALWYDTLGR